MLYTPDPAPAWCGGRFRLAVVVSGPQTKLLATPNSAAATRSCHVCDPGVISSAIATMTRLRLMSPVPANARGCIRSTNRPTGRASRIETTAWGAKSSAACVGSSPRTVCA